jgi:hypothetical protein
MRNFKLFAVTTDLPSIAGSRRLGKKLYITIGVIVALVTITLALLIPQGGAAIPLNVNYTVGEKMLYTSTITSTLQNYTTNQPSELSPQVPNSTTLTAKETIEVMDFDGQNYLLNHTTTMNVKDHPLSFSLIEKMNKTGYSTYVFNFGNTELEVNNTSITSNSYLAQLLNKPEVKVGDTITVLYPTVTGIETTGDLTITFQGIEDLTVPAGTYRVFRIDLTGNGITLRSPANPIINMASTIDINYQVYLEYGTLRQIKSTMQETNNLKSSMINATTQITMDMTLEKHIKP